MLSIPQSTLDSPVEMLDTWKFPKEKVDPVYHGFELYGLTKKTNKNSPDWNYQDNTEYQDVF